MFWVRSRFAAAEMSVNHDLFLAVLCRVRLALCSIGVVVGEGFKFDVFHDLDPVVWRQLLKLPIGIWHVLVLRFFVIGDTDLI